MLPYIGWVLFGVLAVVLVLLGYISGIVTMFCWFKKSKVKKTPSTVYDYIEMQGIATANNKCYVTKTVPELPKPRESNTSALQSS